MVVEIAADVARVISFGSFFEMAASSSPRSSRISGSMYVRPSFKYTSASVLLATGLAAGASPVFLAALSYSSSLYSPHSLSVSPMVWARPRSFTL